MESGDPSVSPCGRCLRRGHAKDTCYAKTYEGGRLIGDIVEFDMGPGFIANAMALVDPGRDTNDPAARGRGVTCTEKTDDCVVS